MAGLKFRVLLDSSDSSEIFRDILINEEDNFETFYKAIIKAFHFSDQQMASFYMSNDEWDKGYEISLFDMSFGDEIDENQPGVMNTSIIKDFIESPDQKIILVHDFLRMWIFLIELIGYENEAPEEPKVVLLVGEAPAEDSKQADENMAFEGESQFGEDEDEDEFGFNEFEDGFDDYGDFEEFDY